MAALPGRRERAPSNRPSFPVSRQADAVSTVSSNLMRAMMLAGTTPDKLGTALGHRDGRYIRAILSGRKRPSTGMIEKIAGKLGVPPEELTRLPRTAR